jgi:hypothetical protein
VGHVVDHLGFFGHCGQPRKLLVFAFWELRRILLAISEDWLLDFRAMSILVITQVSSIHSADCF